MPLTMSLNSCVTLDMPLKFSEPGLHLSYWPLSLIVQEVNKNGGRKWIASLGISGRKDSWNDVLFDDSAVQRDKSDNSDPAAATWTRGGSRQGVVRGVHHKSESPSKRDRCCFPSKGAYPSHGSFVEGGGGRSSLRLIVLVCVSLLNRLRNLSSFK